MSSNSDLPTANVNPNLAAVSVITTCYGRNKHLFNLLSSLQNGSVKPAEVIIINDDADPKRLAEFDLNIIKIPTTISSITKAGSKAKFDIGHNRNLGSEHASQQSLIFLDVDCIVASYFVEQLSLKLQLYPEALLMAQPRYLTRPLTDEESLQLQQGQLSASHLDQLSVYNPYRYNFDPEQSQPSASSSNLTESTDLTNSSGADDTAKPQTPSMQTDDYGAFWSLCFAITRQQFTKIGGFDTQYVGYGAEDTDFAFTARTLGIDLYLTADVAYHQQHSVYRPPLNHLDSIVLNANRFYNKWQHWPMQGWLEQFESMGLIDWQEQQQTPIEIIRSPTKKELDSAYCADAPFV